MREIKFRAWNGRKILEWSERADDICSHLSGEYDNDFELMQFTGLKDKNGTDIYEGDIIEISADSYRLGRDASPAGDEETKNNLHRFTVEYTDKMGGFLLYDVNDRALYGELTHGTYLWTKVGRDYHDDSVIIGNIYENGDLLK